MGALTEATTGNGAEKLILDHSYNLFFTFRALYLWV